MNNQSNNSQYNFNDKKNETPNKINQKLIISFLVIFAVVSTGILFIFFNENNSKKLAEQEKLKNKNKIVATAEVNQNKNLNANVNQSSTVSAGEIRKDNTISNVIEKKIAENQQEKAVAKNNDSLESKPKIDQNNNTAGNIKKDPIKVTFTLYPSNYETIFFNDVRIMKPVIIVNTEDKKIIHMPIERIIKIIRHSYYSDNTIVDENVTNSYTF